MCDRCAAQGVDFLSIIIYLNIQHYGRAYQIYELMSRVSNEENVCACAVWCALIIHVHILCSE